MGAGGGLWEAADVITHARMNQKTVFVGAAAPGELYDGELWYDTAHKCLSVYDNAGAAWLALSNQSGSATTASGTKAVTFPVEFAATPKVFCQINDGTDGIVKISSITAAGFTATVRVFSTASFISDVTTPTASEAAHTHAVSGTSGTEAAHTHPQSVGTGDNFAQASSAIYDKTVQAGPTQTGLYAASSSGGSPTTFFLAVTNCNTPHIPTTGGTFSGQTVVTSVGAIGAGSSHSHSVSINSGAGSSHSHTITHSHANAVAGWANAGAVSFNWLAVV